MIIEKLQLKDVAQAIALQQQIVPYDLDPVCAEKHYKTLLNNPDYFIAVAREGDTLAGTVTGICCRGLGCNFLTIEDMIVREDLRGCGIGTKLMAAIDAFGRSRGCSYAILVSSGFRTRAHRFYEKIGYIEDVRGFRKGL